MEKTTLSVCKSMHIIIIILYLLNIVTCLQKRADNRFIEVGQNQTIPDFIRTGARLYASPARSRTECAVKCSKLYHCVLTAEQFRYGCLFGVMNRTLDLQQVEMTVLDSNITVFIRDVGNYSLDEWQSHYKAFYDCDSRPCENGGTCRDGVGRDYYTCSCVEGFTGQQCQTEVPCPALSDPSDGSVSVNDSSLVSGTVATYSCNAGYVVTGTATRTCGNSGSWDGSAPNCTQATSCEDVYNAGQTSSGVYTILVNLVPVEVFCQMTNGNAWTVFQRRLDGSVEFYRNWTSYQDGFGDVSGEYWLGLDHLAALTATNDYVLRVEMSDFTDATVWAEYSEFAVGPESDNYRLVVTGYSGTARDSLNNHNGHEFTTYDRDNDEAEHNCAVLFYGAFWYNRCYACNPNGRYYTTPTNNDQGVGWYFWKQSRYSMKTMVMMMRPRDNLYYVYGYAVY